MSKRLWLLLSILFLLGFKSDLHKFYVSMTTINISRNGEKLECSTKLFRDDFEAALSDFKNEKVLLELGIVQNEDLNTIDQYFDAYFRISENDVTPVRKLIGVEVEEELVWVYVEYNKPSKSFELINTCLMEKFDEQVNIVHFKQNDETQSKLLRLNETRATFFLE